MNRSVGFLLFISCLILLFSCKEKNEFLTGDNMVLYDAPKKISFDEIVYTASMKGKMNSDTLMVEVTSENTGDKPVELVFTRAELMGQNGVRSKVVGANRLSVKLMPGQETTDTVYFRPINDMDLYKHTDLYGEFGDSYFFLPGAIGSVLFSSKGIKLIAEESSFNDYKTQALYDEVVVYDIVNSGELRDTLLRNLSSLYDEIKKQNIDTKNLPKPGVQISKKEIMAGGFGMLIKAYRYEGKLNVIWRMINHQGQTVYFDPAKFEIITDGGTQMPLELTYIDKPSSWDDTTGVLKKGERVGILLKYETISDQSVVFRPSVTYGQGSELIGTIPLKRINLTSQGQE